MTEFASQARNLDALSFVIWPLCPANRPSHGNRSRDELGSDANLMRLRRVGLAGDRVSHGRRSGVSPSASNREPLVKADINRAVSNPTFV
jgi:hypothetical protein